jgi:dihydropteroate synthase
MQKAPRYDNLAREITEFLRSRIDACVNAGIDRKHLLVDPGFGFGKTRKHNHTLMSQLWRFSELGVPLLIGVSRKAFVRALVQIDSEEILDEMSALLALLAVDQGAKFVRVHNARLTRDLLENHSVLEQTSP